MQQHLPCVVPRVSDELREEALKRQSFLTM